jgi:hypothetical protein
LAVSWRTHRTPLWQIHWPSTGISRILRYVGTLLCVIHGWRLTLAQIPGALFLALGARFYSGLSGPGFKLFDRHRPRDFIETLKSADLDEEVHWTREESSVHVSC